MIVIAIILALFLCLIFSPVVLAGVSIVRVFLKALFTASGRPNR